MLPREAVQDGQLLVALFVKAQNTVVESFDGLGVPIYVIVNEKRGVENDVGRRVQAGEAIGKLMHPLIDGNVSDGSACPFLSSYFVFDGFAFGKKAASSVLVRFGKVAAVDLFGVQNCCGQ